MLSCELPKRGRGVLERGIESSFHSEQVLAGVTVSLD